MGVILEELEGKLGNISKLVLGRWKNRYSGRGRDLNIILRE